MRGVGSLPYDAAGPRIDGAPRSPRDGLPARLQLVRIMQCVGDSRVDSLSIARRAPLDASRGAAGSDRSAPQDVAAEWIDAPKHAALLADAEDSAQQVAA